MNRYNLLRFEELESRQMLSADASIVASPILPGIVNHSDSLIATINSPVPALHSVNEEAAEILSQRVREGVAEAVEALTPASIDVVLARIADDPIDLISAFQSPTELRLSFDAVSPDIDSLATRFSRLSQLVADRDDRILISDAVRSSLQEAFSAVRSRAIDELREMLVHSEMPSRLIPTGKGTTVALTNNGHDTIPEKPLQSRPDRLEPVPRSATTINQVPTKLNAAQHGLRADAQETPENSLTIPLGLSERAAVADGNNPEQSSAMPLQREHVSINYWIREISSTPAENMVHALIELHVSLGEPLGDFANLAGIADFEFDSLMQADRPITDVRARVVGGLTLLATATIVVGHIKRSGRRENQVVNLKLIGEIANSHVVDAFDETVRYNMPRLEPGALS